MHLGRQRRGGLGHRWDPAGDALGAARCERDDVRPGVLGNAGRDDERDLAARARRPDGRALATPQPSSTSAARSPTRRTGSCTARRRFLIAAVPKPRPAIHDEIEALVLAAGGRTLALFTSRRAMTVAAEVLAGRLPWPVLVQGELPKAALLEALSSQSAACLFATMSFWQGVDVPGPALTLVVIDRIPFPRPDDPLMAARREAAGRAGFQDGRPPAGGDAARPGRRTPDQDRHRPGGGRRPRPASREGLLRAGVGQGAASDATDQGPGRGRSLPPRDPRRGHRRAAQRPRSDQHAEAGGRRDATGRFSPAEPSRPASRRLLSQLWSPPTEPRQERRRADHSRLLAQLLAGTGQLDCLRRLWLGHRRLGALSVPLPAQR